MWWVKNHRSSGPTLSIINSSLIDLATPLNLSIWWNFGSCLGLILGVQILSGIFLAIHYCNDASLSFDSISHIVRDVWGGWFLRSCHANGASFFFLALYAHIGRGIYYGSYMYVLVWVFGVLLLLLVMASAFLGYVLPWGQISFWGATVITNLLSAFPYVGTTLVTWLWGGFAVDYPTLSRFFTFHFLIPFLVSAITIFHIFYLHQTGSNNPLGISSRPDSVPFHSYFSYNDIFGFCVLLSLLIFVILFYPSVLGEADNFIPANAIITPAHIVPEWYFLFAYAILRSIPAKLGGVIAMFSSLLVLLTLPLSHSQSIKGLAFYGPVKAIFWLFVASFLILTVGGSWPVSEPFIGLTRCFSLLYFSWFLLIGLYRWVWDALLL